MSQPYREQRWNHCVRQFSTPSPRTIRLYFRQRAISDGEHHIPASRFLALAALALSASTDAMAQKAALGLHPPRPAVVGPPPSPSQLRRPPTLSQPLPPPMHVSVQTTMSPSFGGTGGGDFVSPCPGRSLMTGIRARQGSWIDALTPVCNEYDPVHKTLDGPPRPGNENGGPGGGPAQISCLPPRGIVVKIEATQADNHDGSVGVLAVSCGDYFDPTRPVSLAPGSPASFGQSHKGPTFPMSCPAPYVPGGIYGRSGAFVDRIGLMCVHYQYGTP